MACVQPAELPGASVPAGRSLPVHRHEHVQAPAAKIFLFRFSRRYDYLCASASMKRRARVFTNVEAGAMDLRAALHGRGFRGR
jgi:hypothetical protein